MTFKALLATKTGKTISTSVVDVNEHDLMPGDITIAVDYSTVNYKDALAVTGRAEIIRHFPLIAGIDILVTGANGGVGSIAIAILSDLGYRVVASTGRLEEADYLRSLGAAEIIDRRTLSEPGAPIASERWAGAVDSVGSRTLANVLAQTRYRGVVTACGLAQGTDLPASVLPFILRNVTLAGIDSVNAPHEARIQAWSRLARNLDLSKLARTTEVVGLAEVPAVSARMFEGKVRGRTVVDVNA